MDQRNINDHATDATPTLAVYKNTLFRGWTGKEGSQKLWGAWVHQCPQSDHQIKFTIAFPGAPPQPFEGYFFTQGGANRMAGFTWRQGTPFGWFAEKQ